MTHCAPTSIQNELLGKWSRPDDLTDFLEEIRQRCWFRYHFFGYYHGDGVIQNQFVLLYQKIINLKERDVDAILNKLYDQLYTPPSLTETEKEIDECHRKLVEHLERPERQFALQIINCHDKITDLYSGQLLVRISINSADHRGTLLLLPRSSGNGA